MVNALGNVGQSRPLAARRIEAPPHLLGFPAGENTEPAEHIELAPCRRSVDFLFALRNRVERGPLALCECWASRQQTSGKQDGRGYRSAHCFPPLFAGRRDDRPWHCPKDIASSIAG